MKITLKIISRIVVLIIIIFPLLLIYIWGMPGMSYEIDKHKLDNIYTTIGNRWDIGKEKGFGNKICDSYLKKGCLSGELKGFKKNELGSTKSGIQISNIYIYIEIDESNIRKNIFGPGFIYQLFGPYDKKVINSVDNIPKFGLIIGDEIFLFGKDDLINLSKEMQKTFKDLEKNPTIIIDGIDYLK